MELYLHSYITFHSVNTNITFTYYPRERDNRDNVLGVATKIRPEMFGFKFGRRKRYFSNSFIPAIGPTQPPIQ
jgi:hypothetical protein